MNKKFNCTAAQDLLVHKTQLTTEILTEHVLPYTPSVTEVSIFIYIWICFCIYTEMKNIVAHANKQLFPSPVDYIISHLQVSEHRWKKSEMWGNDKCIQLKLLKSWKPAFLKNVNTQAKTSYVLLWQSHITLKMWTANDSGHFWSFTKNLCRWICMLVMLIFFFSNHLSFRHKPTCLIQQTHQLHSSTSNADMPNDKTSM